MNSKAHKASKARGTGSKDSTLFGTVRENTIATYSRNRPVQIAKKYHFLTPDTPEDWIPSSKETISKQDGAKKKSSMPRNTTLVRRGSTLALRNISNIPLEKTLGRTPCALNQQPRRSNRRLTPSGFLHTKVSSSDDKECKIYRAELQRNNNSKKVSKKSKVLVSTTTYSSKSMSCCSVCGGGVACTHGHNSLSTIKSMSLCQSLPDADQFDDLGLDDVSTSDDSQVSQPHNSTLVEEDCKVELKDIIPQDLSAIMEEPVDEEQSEPPKKSKIDMEIGKLHDGEQASSTVLGPRCSSPTDPENIQPVDPATLDVSPITVNEKICIVPVENKSAQLKKTVCQELNTNEADEPDVTPDAVSNKECTCATVEPKQKRKLAYSVDMSKVPDCILLAKISNKKQPVKLLFKQDNNSQYHWSNLPEDVLVHLS